MYKILIGLSLPPKDVYNPFYIIEKSTKIGNKLNQNPKT